MSRHGTYLQGSQRSYALPRRDPNLLVVPAVTIQFLVSPSNMYNAHARAVASAARTPRRKNAVRYGQELLSSRLPSPSRPGQIRPRLRSGSDGPCSVVVVLYFPKSVTQDLIRRDLFTAAASRAAQTEKKRRAQLRAPTALFTAGKGAAASRPTRAQPRCIRRFIDRLDTSRVRLLDSATLSSKRSKWERPTLPAKSSLLF